MIIWHDGDEIKTEGEIEIHHSASWYIGFVTNHKENAINKIGKKIYMLCSKRPEIAKYFNHA